MANRILTGWARAPCAPPTYATDHYFAALVTDWLERWPLNLMVVGSNPISDLVLIFKY